METVKLAANACIGVGIALLVAGTCAPVRAREALRRSTAQLLEQLGDYAFFVLGEFCQARSGRIEPAANCPCQVCCEFLMAMNNARVAQRFFSASVLPGVLRRTRVPI